MSTVPARARAVASRASSPRVARRASSRPRARVAAARATAVDADATGPWNTAPLALTDDIYAYLLRNTREDAVLRALREETSELRGARMQVAPEQGALLALAVELLDARRVVEMGHVISAKETYELQRAAAIQRHSPHSKAFMSGLRSKVAAHATRKSST